MPRDGNSTYSAPAGTLATTGEIIESAKYNAFIQDLTTVLNTAQPIAVGGTGATTAAGARTALGLDGLVGSIPTVSAAGALDQVGSTAIPYCYVASANCTTVGGPTGGGDGIVFTGYASSGERRYQIYHPVSSDNPSPWRRVYTSSVWSSWVRDQEFDTEDNESYRKSANGSLIATALVTFEEDGNSTLSYEWTPLVAFAATPVVAVTFAGNGTFTNCVPGDISGAVQVTGSGTTFTVSLRRVTGASAWSNHEITNVKLTAVGRWV